MISKENAKREVQKLVERYDALKASGELKNFTGREENTKTTFILPLFKALGWDVHNEKAIEVLTEERVLRGAVDYAFQLQGSYKFFVEAKPIGRNIKEDVKQALEYGVNSGNTWVILTNFESIIVFNCEWREKEWWKNALFEQMDYKDYIAKFDLLWLLSKESMLNNGLEEYAGKVTKRVPRLPVDKELLQNLLQYRLKISKEIQKSGTYSEEETDELIQKLLSRLLFIRNCEDRGFEAKYKLQPLIELYKLHKRGLMKALAGIFKHYDDTYNSGLFEEREIDKIKFDEKLLAEVIESLYFMSDGTRYNFNVIPADIMGNLYEQYLGHILKKTPERTKLKDGKAHRKEQGIYYTPAYIVDYIVKNTVGELLKDKKVKADKIRILDPACGSGSFLIKAFQAMDEYYKSKDKKYDQTKLDSTGSMYSKKVEILQNNIFGVDLDKQAIELARLNLLLQIAEKGEKLPSIEKKIQCGNSLIDDPAVAGEDKAFKWEDRFKDVMDEGGFDVVIGNPPYGLVFKEDEKHFIETNLPTFQRNNDLYVAFIEKAIMLLKEEGLFSFIIPNTYLIGSYFDNLKKFILEKARIIKIVDFGINQVFEDPNVFNSIIILQKIGSNIKREKNIFKFIDVPFIKNTNSLDIDNISVVTDIPQIQLKDMAWKPKNNIIDKLNRQKEKDVIDVCHVKDVGFNYWSEGRGKKRGNSIGSRVLYDGERKNTKDIPYLKGRDIIKYGYVFGNHWLKSDYDTYLDKKVDTFRFSSEFLEISPKLIYRQTADRIIATVDINKYYLDKTVHLIVPKKDIKLNLLALLGILNSKLMLYVYRNLVREEGRAFAQVKTLYIKKIPLKFNVELENKISEFVKRQLEITKRLNELGDKKTDERIRIEEEIKKTDAEIDELVYKLYGITDSEKRIIEESLK